MLYEDDLDNRLCSRLVYGRCWWRMHEVTSFSLSLSQDDPSSPCDFVTFSS